MKVRMVRRFWEVDLARGVAMVMVILYHLVYDLDNFVGYGVDSTGGFWAAFADTSAFLFVFLVGLSLSISRARALTTAPRRSAGGTTRRTHQSAPVRSPSSSSG